MESALTDQVQLDLLHHTRHAIAHLIELFPAEFGWERLIPADARTLPQVPEKLGQLYQEIEEYCSSLAVKFDHDWVRKHTHTFESLLFISHGFNVCVCVDISIGHSCGDNNSR